MQTMTTLQFAETLLKAMWPLLTVALVCVLIPGILLGMVKWIVLRVILYASEATSSIYRSTISTSRTLRRRHNAKLSLNQDSRV